MAFRTGATGPTTTKQPVVWEKYENGSLKSSTPSTRSVSYVHSYFIGRNTPGYHRRVKAGELIPYTFWTQFSLKGECIGVYDVTSQPSKKVVIRHVCIPNCSSLVELPTSGMLADHLPSDGKNLVNEAAAAIYSEGWDSLTFLAELSQVRRMFIDLGHKMLTKTVWPSISWRSLSNEWLSARYGWRPLLYDMKSLSSAITRLNKARVIRHKKQRSAVTGHSVVSEVQHTNADWTIDNHVITDAVKVSSHGTVCADIAVPDFQFNPLVTAWELIRFSFVIDWFLSVGKSLSALSMVMLSSTYTAALGYRVDLRRKVESIRSFPTVPVISGGFTQQAEYEAYYEVRYPCSIPLTPHLTCRLDWKKVIDLVFLIAQRRR